MVVTDEPTVYHVLSRTALDGFPLGAVEKDYLVQLIRRLSSVYFAEVLGFSVLGNHFHLVVRMRPAETVSDAEVRKRFEIYHGSDGDRELTDGQIPLLRTKWASLSEYMREIKQTFSRFYNKQYARRGFFWGDRFKSLIVEDGDTLVNLLAYVELNCVRAGLVERPEQYRWCSLGYHAQTGNKGAFLSLNFGLTAFGEMNDAERFRFYRQFVYRVGSLQSGKGAALPAAVLEDEEARGFALGTVDRFRYRTRYFTDSGVIGTKEFVSRCYRRFAGHFTCRHEKRPRPITGLEGIYSLKRLSEA
jgi:REP element-mobilizing transposase RayT